MFMVVAYSIHTLDQNIGHAGFFKIKELFLYTRWKNEATYTELALETKLMLDQNIGHAGFRLQTMGQVVAIMHCKPPVYRSPAKTKL
jgi:hypothetical protein